MDSVSVFVNRIFPSALSPRQSSCQDANAAANITTYFNSLLTKGGQGYILSLCQGQTYNLEAPLVFTAANQEISTEGYPTGDERAILFVNGTVYPDTKSGHSNAITGSCSQCAGIKIRNIQINGNRAGAFPIGGGANIETGGTTANQLIEYVKSHDPRGWSCMHITEGGAGSLACVNATVQNNDIGPCGVDLFQQWADGISMACTNSVVRNNMIYNPTDGGVVLFGAPGTVVQNNTIWVEQNTALGGINMVDYEPYHGNFTGTTVTGNTLIGGFADSSDADGSQKGQDSENVIMKIGIAIGPRTWFGKEYGLNVSFGGIVENNRFTGAFSYAIAVTSAVNFTVENNYLFGNTSFIGSVGPNCTKGAITPNPNAFIVDYNHTKDITLQSTFVSVLDGDGLTCVEPPVNGSFWPYGGNPAATNPDILPIPDSEFNGDTEDSDLTGGDKAGIAVGVIVGVVVIAILSYFIRNWALKRSRIRQYNPSRF